MRIRMTGDFTHDLKGQGRKRTLPRGGVFEEPDEIARAAVAAGRAVAIDLPPPPASAEAPEGTSEKASGAARRARG